MTFRILPILITGILLLCSPPLWAKSMYITDRIEVGLRSSTGIEQRIITMLKTGDQVEFLEGDKNWSKVRLANGTVGWLATQFLVDQVKPFPPTDPRIQEELRGLKEKNQALTQVKDVLTQERNKLFKDVEEAKRLTQIAHQEKIKQGSPALNELTAKNEKLEKEIASYKKQLADPGRKEKGNYNEGQIKWFLAGSAVLFLGLLFGWLMGRGRRKPSRFY